MEKKPSLYTENGAQAKKIIKRKEEELREWQKRKMKGEEQLQWKEGRVELDPNGNTTQFQEKKKNRRRSIEKKEP